jgi:hypothetical protein
VKFVQSTAALLTGEAGEHAAYAWSFAIKNATTESADDTQMTRIGSMLT